MDADANNAADAPFRLGVVDYLNMQPLIYGLQRCPARELELHHGPPSRLARWLEEGRIDMGMVPAGALFAHPEWVVVGRSMIGSRGPARSVLAMGAGPPEQWRVLRPDSHSVTSNALCRILLERRLGLRPRLGEPIPPDGWTPPDPLPVGEAFVAIGSRALRWSKAWQAEGRPWTGLDLADMWTRWTDLPFVFALWIARPGASLGEWPERLEALKEENRPRIPQIAQQWPRLERDGLTVEEGAAYLTENIHFDLTDPALAGLERFYDEGRRLGLFPEGWQLRHIDRAEVHPRL